MSAPPPDLDRDSLHRFVIETGAVRGVLVRMHASWEAVRDIHPYPPPVRQRLGEALAAVLLLSTTLKLEGSLILQAQGRGPLRTLVAQASAARTVRGLARWEGEVPDGSLVETFGPGHLVLTTHTLGGEPYQGIVSLEGEDFAGALEQYFAQSEQLATRLWLATDAGAAAGLLLQVLPSADRDADDWPRLTLLADTVSPAELLQLPAEDLLLRLFHEERVRLLDSEPVAFRCNCSRPRIEQTLAALGAGRLAGLADADGALEVTCEFCNRTYRYDRVDVERTLAAGTAVEGPHTVQ